MNNISDIWVIVAALFMIVGVVSILSYLKRLFEKVALKKYRREALYKISFYLKGDDNKDNLFYEERFSIIPQINGVIILPNGDNDLPYLIKNVVYNTVKDSKKSSDVLISISPIEDKFL